MAGRIFPYSFRSRISVLLNSDEVSRLIRYGVRLGTCLHIQKMASFNIIHVMCGIFPGENEVQTLPVALCEEKGLLRSSRILRVRMNKF